jgi:hypothetical protein
MPSVKQWGTSNRNGTRLLLAVGDNSPPFVLSRRMLLNEDDIAKLEEQTKTWFLWKPDKLTLDDKSNYEPGNGNWVPFTGDPSRRYLQGLDEVPTDNVACFFERDAV